VTADVAGKRSRVAGLGIIMGGADRGAIIAICDGDPAASFRPATN